MPNDRGSGIGPSFGGPCLDRLLRPFGRGPPAAAVGKPMGLRSTFTLFFLLAMMGTACAQGGPTDQVGEMAKGPWKMTPPADCGVRASDWCPPPKGDPCGAHPDEKSCRAD